MNAVTLEIQYTDQNGDVKTLECADWKESQRLSKLLAQQTGRRVIIRRTLRKNWSVYTVCLATSQVKKAGFSVTKREAIELWRQIDELESGTVCIFWPRWAPKIERLIRRSRFSIICKGPNKSADPA
jgi:hypothetical protein